MNPSMLLEAAEADGVRLSVTLAGAISAHGDRAAVQRWLPAIKAHKKGLVTTLSNAPKVANPAEEGQEKALAPSGHLRENDLAEGWRRRLATDTWHRDWSATWQRGGAPVTADTLPDAITRTVNAWDAVTGDKRTAAEYRAHLNDDDLADRQVMNRAWLGLYAWTLWHHEAQA